MPGDLSKWRLQGLGLDTEIATRYDDELESDPDNDATDAPGRDPILSPPPQQPAGGLLYFDEFAKPEKLRAALETLGVYVKIKDFAVFATIAKNVMNERYLDQVRILSTNALGRPFKVRAEAEVSPERPVSLGEYVETFVRKQRDKWNGPAPALRSKRLRGTLGSTLWRDDESQRESLAFGFAVEDTYWGVYRLWSRPYLCLK